MKKFMRVLSMLLAFALLVGLLPTLPLLANAAVEDTPEGVRNHLPETATDVKYLSDMTWEFSQNEGYTNDRRKTKKDGCWEDMAAIVLGGTVENGGTSFPKGLGVMPANSTADHNTASRTIFDLSDNNYAHNYFYSAVGITNRNADNTANQNYGVIFEVWASYDKSEENYADAEYVLLERSDVIKTTSVYQFHLDVTGVRYLKLVVYSETLINCMNSAWAGACLYNNEGYYPKTDMFGDGPSNGNYVEPANPTMFNTYQFNKLPSKATLLVSQNYRSLATEDGKLYTTPQQWVGGTHTDGEYQKDGILPAENTFFYFGARPASESDGRADGYVVYDVSKLNVNTFYSIVGAVNYYYKINVYNADNGAYGGLVFEVWGTYTDGGEYKLLSASEPILRSNTGEFIVDITGVKLLKLVVRARDNRNIASSTGGFFYASVYNNWEIKATGESSVVQGSEATFNTSIWHDFAAVSDYTGTVSWSVAGATKSGTKMEGSKLVVDPYEQAGTDLKVTASITEDGTTFISDPVTVTVQQSPAFALEIQSPSEVVKGSVNDITASVTKDETPIEYIGEITWAVSGNADPATKVENGKLTIGNESAGTELTVTASLTEYGITRTATKKITVISYAVDIEGYTEMLPGKSVELNAAVSREGQTVDGTVTWTVEGADDYTVNGNKVEVSSKNETGTITVKATYTPASGDSVVVTHVIAVNDYKLTLNGTDYAVSQGSATTIGAGVKKNGTTDVTDAVITWKITGMADGSAIEKNGYDLKLIVNEPADTVLTITASIEVGGETVSDTRTITVTDYAVDITTPGCSVLPGGEVILGAAVTQDGVNVDGAQVQWSVSGGSGPTTITNGKLNIASDEAVGTKLSVVATYTVGSMTVASEPITFVVTDYKIVVEPSTQEVPRGSVATLVANVTKGTQAVDNAVINWKVSKVDGSSLETNGTALRLSANDVVGTELTVVATTVINGETIVSAPVTVTIIAAPAYSVVITDPVTSLKQGAKASFAAAVTKDGEDVDDAEIIWRVAGKTSADTAIDSNGNLTVGKDEAVGTNLMITASILVDGELITSEAALVKVEVAPKQDDAYKTNTGEYEVVPNGATYLSNMEWVESNNESDTEAVRDGTHSRGNPIWLGGASGGDVTDGTKFDKGLGVMPFAPNDGKNGAADTIWDVSALNVTDFYAVVGITNVNGQNYGYGDAYGNGTFEGGGVIFQVYGTYEDDGEFVLLAESDVISKTKTGEFNVDITGVKLLKLVVKCNLDGAGNHASMNSAWGNACVYATNTYTVTATGTETSVQQGKDTTFTATVTKNGAPWTGETVTWTVTGGTKSGTQIDANGKLTIDAKEPAGTKLNVTAGITVDGTPYTSNVVVVTVEAAPVVPSQKDAYKVVTRYQTLGDNVIYLSDTEWEVSNNESNTEAVIDGTHAKGNPIWLGGTSGGDVTDGTKFDKGLGVMPFEPNDGKNGAADTIWDISALNVTDFYAVVGITNVNGQNYGYGDAYGNGTFQGGGVIFQVYGTYEDNGEFVLLAESDVISKTKTGEFNVDITGVKLLKLVVKCDLDGAGNHASMNSAWGNACVYAATSSDTYTVTATGAATSVMQGKDTTFTAAATKNGQALTDATISWAVTGGTKSGTKIDANGKLTIDAKEPAGTKLNVTASITVDGTTYTSSAVVVTVEAAPVVPSQKDAFKVVTQYASLADNVIYLSDKEWKESNNEDDTEAVRDGTHAKGSPIWLGGEVGGDATDGTKFDKGLGVMPYAPNDGKNGAADTIWDISSLNVNKFYAVVGITNVNGQNYGYGDAYGNGTFQGSGVIFQVYGTYEDNGEFVLLAESDVISKTKTGEFNVDITGVKLLKLVVKCDLDGAGNHASMNSAWGNACVYTSTSTDTYTVTATGTETSVMQGKDTTFTAAVTKNGEALTDATIIWAVTGGTKSGTKIDDNGKLTVDAKEPAGTKLTVTAGITVDGTTYTSSAVVVTVTAAPVVPSQKNAYKVVTQYETMGDNVIYLSDINWVGSNNEDDTQAVRNGTHLKGSPIWLGGASGGDATDGTKFDKGLGVMPYAPNDGKNGAADTIWDISGMNATNFYAVVGITNVNGQNYGYGDVYGDGTFQGGGVIFQVYGAYDQNGDYVLLAESDVITKTKTGEFNVDITGVKLLKLVVKCNLDGAGNHASMNSAWGNACVYNKDGSLADTSVKPQQENAYFKYAGYYMVLDGEIVYLSDIDWMSSVNEDNTEAIRNGTHAAGDPIWIGGEAGGGVNDGTKFKKGLGVMPFAPNDGKNGAAETIWDVSGLNVDTFYSVVGITNLNGQNYGYGDAYNGGTFAGGGVIFQVYGTYEENGEFVLLAQSDLITKTRTGEFKVDITGVKLLKLVVKCELNTRDGHASMNSAWANACVFNSATGSVGDVTIPEGGDETTTPTRPPRPTSPTDGNTGNNDGNSGLVYVFVILTALLVVLLAALGFYFFNKKKRRVA